MRRKMNLKTRTKRIELGVCIGCGGELDTDGKWCSKCRKKERDESKIDRDFYLSNKICPYCRKETLFGSERACPECRTKRTETVNRTREKTKYNIMQICENLDLFKESKEKNLENAYVVEKELHYQAMCIVSNVLLKNENTKESNVKIKGLQFREANEWQMDCVISVEIRLIEMGGRAKHAQIK